MRFDFSSNNLATMNWLWRLGLYSSINARSGAAKLEPADRAVPRPEVSEPNTGSRADGVRSRPDLFECDHVGARSGPTSIRVHHLTAANGWPIHDANELIGPCGFARRTVIPGLRGKCVHGRSPDAVTSVNIARVGRGGRSGVMPRVHMSLASHCGSCDRGGCDQRSRQEFSCSHSISPWI
jgi:hypothetical protein